MSTEKEKGTFSAANLQQYLMNGVSHMIPVVVSGGILYAIATMLSMNSVTTEGAVQASNVFIDVFSQIGGVGLGLMVPVLSAYIAAGIADRPGIAPGLICGQLAVNVGAGSYTTADPGRLIPINVIASAAGGAVAGALGAWCNAAWGGLVVLPVTSVGTYLVGLAVGLAVHILLVMALKKNYVEPEVEEELSLDDIEIEF